LSKPLVPQQLPVRLLVALIAPEIIWFGYWGVAFPLARLGIYQLPMPGVRVDVFVGSVNLFNVAMTYLLMVCLVATVVLIVRQSRFALWTYTTAAILHLYLWVSLVFNSNYSGNVGYFIIVIEAIVIYLLVTKRGVPAIGAK
jgi:hypothetical protein